MSQAVITGVGVVSPFGVGAPCFWDALAQGRSAIRPISSFDARTLPSRMAGEVPVVDADAAWLREQAAALMTAAKSDAGTAALLGRIEQAAPSWQELGMLRDRKVAFAILAALEAWQDARLGPADTHAWLCLALGLERALLDDFLPLMTGGPAPDGRIDWSREPDAGLPATRFRAPVDVASTQVADILGLTGPVVVHTSACAAGALAVMHAASLIERGTADIVVCGASDSMLNPMGMGGMCRLGAPSPRNEPDACRPFDRRRDGLVMGEGAAVFVVEHEDRALGRGVTPLARIAGWGSTQDGYKATAPRPDGAPARKAMQAALARGRLLPGHVGYINAHGTGTLLNDPVEARAIRDAFGHAADHLPVSSIKGAVGHLMAASGAMELAACLMAFDRDLLPGTAHHHDRDPECPIHVIGPTPLAARVDAVLSNSFGFGGQNASVILQRWESRA